MSHLISFPRTARLGSGALDELPAVVAELGVQRAVLVTDAFMVQSGVVDRVRRVLDGADVSTVVFSETVPDPTTASLAPGLDLVREHQADVLIALGGGSPIDSAKALAVLSVHQGTMRSLKAPTSYAGPAVPVIAIPTTAGTGSEATQFTVITDSDTDEKMLCPGLSYLPVATLVDFELTMSMPPRLTADTGLDALTHAVEAYVSRRANPVSDALALGAIRQIGIHLVRAYTDPADRVAREAMMSASFLAGMAFSNSSVALVHGMSRPMGAHFHLAHGLANAMLFPAVTEFSLDSAIARYADCARALGVVSSTAPDEAASKELCAALRSLCFELEVPTPASYGIGADAWQNKLNQMAVEALASGSPANNPRIPDQIEIAALYSTIYS